MSEIRVDTISEKTSANGVAIDGLTIKDGGITATTGAIVFNEAGADLDFRVESNDNTHMLFVDGGNNRVGIGTTPDLGVGLHIRTADSGMGSVNANADELIIEGSGASGISILSGASSKSNLFFGDSGSNVIGNISYNHSDNALEFATNGANQWFIDSSGNLLPAATDHGIYLGVTSATASNLLDDYEEGTWTSTLTTTGTAFTTSSNTQTQFYTKVGRLVTLSISCSVASPSSGSGNLKLTGLPFTSGSHDTTYCNITRPGRIDCTSGDGIFASMFSSSSTITFEKSTDNANPTAVAASDLNGNTTPFLGFSFSYYV
tara:strand:+ start:202 stop:1155 length:954 start_codon:yes stop_codon:yes gene_type:complete